MKEYVNKQGQVVGFVVENWQAPDFPMYELLLGHYCRVEPLDINRHVQELFEAYELDEHGQMWTYLPYGPFKSVAEYKALLENFSERPEQQFYAVIDLKTKRALGIAAYLRINSKEGSIEVGHLSYSPLLQRSTIATEAMYLMMKKIFEAGYRRYEWKCNSLNEASRASAIRLGFQFEGIFRQSNVIKKRNRDTAWYSIIDTEWFNLKIRFEAWLSQSNFDESGLQRKALCDFSL